MKNMWRKIIMTLCCVAGASMISLSAKEIAMTIDDLPFVGAEEEKEMTTKLLTAMKEKNIPVIGFVNEKQIEEKPFKKELLAKWVDMGFDLGNHTYSHASLHELSVPDYKKEILKGEEITKDLLKNKGKELRYFRHPYLHTGRSVDIKEEMKRFFKEKNYQIAPITVDNSDWVFARAFEKVIAQNNLVLQKKIKEAYIPYLSEKIDYFEKQSQILFGRPIAQVMLLHASRLNAHMMPSIIKMIEEKKYQLVSLEKALTDSAYKEMEDLYVGPAGISWLHRYALVQKKEVGVLKGEPRCPAFVMQLAEVSGE